MPASQDSRRPCGGESGRSLRSLAGNGSGSGNAARRLRVRGRGIGQAGAVAGDLAQAAERLGVPQRIVEGVVRPAAGRARGPVGLKGGMPWAALDADGDRLEVETGVPRRGVVEEPPFVPVKPHGVEAGGGGDEHRAMPEVAGDLAEPVVVLRHGVGRGQQRLGPGKRPCLGVLVPEALRFGVRAVPGSVSRLAYQVPRGSPSGVHATAPIDSSECGPGMGPSASMSTTM